MVNEPERVMPKCPDCKQPLPLIMHQIDTPTGLILSMVCCALCGYVVTCFPIGMKEPRLVGANGQIMRLVKPS
jgi:C4-type Zn-finger protein